MCNVLQGCGRSSHTGVRCREEYRCRTVCMESVHWWHGRGGGAGLSRTSLHEIKKITVFFCLNESVLHFFWEWFNLKGKSTKKMQPKYIYFEETISGRAEKLNTVSLCHVCLLDSLIQTRLTRSNVNKRHWPPINVDASLNVRSNSCSLNRARCPHIWAHKLSFIASVLHWCCVHQWMSRPVDAQHWQGSILASCLLWHTL